MLSIGRITNMGGEVGGWSASVNNEDYPACLIAIPDNTWENWTASVSIQVTINILSLCRSIISSGHPKVVNPKSFCNLRSQLSLIHIINKDIIIFGFYRINIMYVNKFLMSGLLSLLVGNDVQMHGV